MIKLITKYLGMKLLAKIKPIYIWTENLIGTIRT